MLKYPKVLDLERLVALLGSGISLPLLISLSYFNILKFLTLLTSLDFDSHYSHVMWIWALQISKFCWTSLIVCLFFYAGPREEGVMYSLPIHSLAFFFSRMRWNGEIRKIPLSQKQNCCLLNDPPNSYQEL